MGVRPIESCAAVLRNDAGATSLEIRSAYGDGVGVETAHGVVHTLVGTCLERRLAQAGTLHERHVCEREFAGSAAVPCRSPALAQRPCRPQTLGFMSSSNGPPDAWSILYSTSIIPVKPAASSRRREGSSTPDPRSSRRRCLHDRGRPGSGECGARRASATPLRTPQAPRTRAAYHHQLPVPMIARSYLSPGSASTFPSP